MKKLIYVLGAKIWHYNILISLILFFIMLFIDLKAPVINLLNQSEIETIETNDNFEVKIGVVEFQPFFAGFINGKSIAVRLKQISGDHRAIAEDGRIPQGDSLLDYSNVHNKKERVFLLEGIAPSEVGKISFSVSAEDASDNISSIIIPVNVTQAPPLRVCENGEGTSYVERKYCCKEDISTSWVTNNDPNTNTYLTHLPTNYCDSKKIKANYGRVPSFKRMERKW